MCNEVDSWLMKVSLKTPRTQKLTHQSKKEGLKKINRIEESIQKKREEKKQAENKMSAINKENKEK